MSSFFAALALIFVAELGDKTQLLALALASRYDTKRVFLGVFLGTYAVNLLSVGAGELIGARVPHSWIAIAAGVAFVGFGIWMLFDDDDDNDNESEVPRKEGGIVLSVAVTIFLAEMGDKTMLAAMTIASHEQNLLPVWLGAGTGMFGAIAIGAAIGSVLGKRLPEKPIRMAASLLFLVSGLWVLYSAFR